MCKKIYIAGAYSSDNVIGVLNNIRNGIRLSTEVFLLGFFPFCPFTDFNFHLMLRDNESISVDDYYKYSMAWLKVSDALLVGSWPGCEYSKGTKAEIEEAKRLKIPIYFSLQDLIDNES